MMSIAENIEQIRQRIEIAARKSGRSADDILLVAVTKTRPASDLNEAIDAGIADVGENKVQEIMDKYEDTKPVNWHLIGHLQTNKVKYIIDKVSLIHSLDSLKLALEIDKRAKLHDRMVDVLIQVNSAEEESKFGITTEETETLIRDVLEKCSNIRIKGLMCIAPFAEDPNEVKVFFDAVKKQYDEFSKISHERLDFQYLSMGMSHDFEVAIEAGANLVRVGTAIFGGRSYNR